MNKKNLLAVFLIAAVALAVFAYLRHNPAGKPGSPETITVTAFLPLTGPSADIGKWQQNGIQIAEEEINGAAAAGKTPKIKVLFEDTAGDIKTATTVFEKSNAVAESSAYIVSLSSVANAISSKINEKPKPALLLAVSLPEITKHNQNYFRFNLGSEQEAVAMAQHLKAIGTKKVAVMRINDEFGIGALNAFNNAFAGEDRAVVFTESYEREQLEFRSTLAQLEKAGAEAVYVIGYVKSSVVLIRQLREIGNKLPVYANMALSVPAFLNLGGESLHGTVFTVADYEPGTAVGEAGDFVQKYKKRFGEPPPFFSAFSHDALRVIHRAATQKGNLHDNLTKIPAFSNALNSDGFDEIRNLKIRVRLAQNDEGTLKLLD
jgi:branched-chain amino acid transport system substrate-binding protein